MKSSGWILSVAVAAFLFAPGFAEARDGYRTRTKAAYTAKNKGAQLRIKRKGVSSYGGKRYIKRLVKRGNIKHAKRVLRSMKKRPNRKGIKGQVDRYRKWSAKRIIQKKERQIKIDKFLSKKHEPIPLYLYPMP